MSLSRIRTLSLKTPNSFFKFSIYRSLSSSSPNEVEKEVSRDFKNSEEVNQNVESSEKDPLLKTQNPFFNFSIFRSLSSSPSSAQSPNHNNEALHLQTQINELKEKISDLEKQIRHLKQSEEVNQNVKVRVSNSSGGKSAKKKLGAKRNGAVSNDMKMFLTHLYNEGYFKGADFLTVKGDKLDFVCFTDSYGRDYIKFVAEKFGKDKQDIAEGLSVSDLKMVALFGCPSLAKKIVFSSKRLRLFFGIEEETVCSKCVLKDSCRLVNQNVEKDSNSKTFNLADIMRVITIYALEASDPNLSVPEEIKASASRLLNEILKLSQTTS